MCNSLKIRADLFSFKMASNKLYFHRIVYFIACIQTILNRFPDQQIQSACVSISFCNSLAANSQHEDTTYPIGWFIRWGNDIWVCNKWNLIGSANLEIFPELASLFDDFLF